MSLQTYYTQYRQIYNIQLTKIYDMFWTKYKMWGKFNLTLAVSSSIGFNTICNTLGCTVQNMQFTTYNIQSNRYNLYDVLHKMYSVNSPVIRYITMHNVYYSTFHTFFSIYKLLYRWRETSLLLHPQMSLYLESAPKKVGSCKKQGYPRMCPWHIKKPDAWAFLLHASTSWSNLCLVLSTY